MKRAIVVLGLILAACGDRAVSDRSVDRGTDQERVSVAESVIRSRLKDPQSARFSSTYVSNRSVGGAVCGKVDVMNSFGAYVGPARYLVSDAAVFIASPDNTAVFEKQWAAACQPATAV